MSVVVRNFLRNLLPAAALAAVLGFGGWVTNPVEAGLVYAGDTANVYGQPWTFTNGLPRATMRWGKGNYEASIRAGSPPTDVVTMDPAGAPIWQDGGVRDFAIIYTAATGKFTFGVDWNKDSVFLNDVSTETISFNVEPNTGFRGIRFYNNEASIKILGFNSPLFPLNVRTNLGDSDVTPLYNQTAYYTWTNSAAVMSDLIIEGTIQFTSSSPSSYSDESRWEIGLTGATAVPEPGSLSLLAVGLAGLVGIRRRRS